MYKYIIKMVETIKVSSPTYFVAPDGTVLEGTSEQVVGFAHGDGTVEMIVQSD